MIILIMITTIPIHAIILNACFDSLYTVTLYLLTSYSLMKYVNSIVMMNINEIRPFQPASKLKYLYAKKNAIMSIPNSDNANLNAFWPWRFLFFTVMMINIVTSRITITMNEITLIDSIICFCFIFDFYNYNYLITIFNIL